MTKSYSLDLRRRVARFVEAGHSCHATAWRFDVSVAFVVRLMAAYRATGSLAAEPEGGWRYSKLDPHREFLVERVTEKGDITMPQLAAELLALGTKITPVSISRWFIRNGYSVKKARMAKLTGRPAVREPQGRQRDHAESGCAAFARRVAFPAVGASSSSAPGSPLPSLGPKEPARGLRWRQ
jgi:transposase